MPDSSIRAYPLTPRSSQATLKAGKPVGAASSAPPPVPILPQDLSAYAAGGDLSPSISNSPLTASGGGSKPKRSKSLAARFRAGRKNPNNPMLDADPSSSGEDGRIAGTASGPGSYDAHEAGSASVPVSPVDERRGLREWPLGASVPASIGATHAQSHANGLVASVPASRGRPSEPVANGRANGDVKQLEVRTQAIKFDESLSSPTLERASAAAAMNRSLTDDGSASPTSGSGKKSNGLKRLFSTKRKVCPPCLTVAKARGARKLTVPDDMRADLASRGIETESTISDTTMVAGDLAHVYGGRFPRTSPLSRNIRAIRVQQTDWKS